MNRKLKSRTIYCAFFTKRTIYEDEVERLRESLAELKLPYHLRPVDDRGSWNANTQRTAEHICEMLSAYPDRPVVQLDADAYVHRVPKLFEDGIDCDIAVHYRQGHELLNGTVYLAPTPGARLVAEKYLEIVKANPGQCNEQLCLDYAIKELADLIRVYKLPAGLCWISDIMRNDLAEGEEVFIEHLQCSRVVKGTGLLQSRINRIAELEASRPIGVPNG